MWASTTLVHAASGIGFIQDNIWYSKDQFFAGEVVRIYSAVFNSSPSDMVGTVAFFDNETSIGTADFTATSSHLREVWVDWRSTSGTHKISAKITKAFSTVAGKPQQPVPLSDVDSGSSEIVVAAPPVVSAPISQSAGDAQGFTAQATEVATKVVGESKNFLDALAKDWDASLAITQKDLEKEVAVLRAKEQAVVTTSQGQALNDAVSGGDSSSSPVLSAKHSGTVGDTVHRLTKQLLLLLVKAARWILETPIALYASAVVVVFFVLRTIWRIMRRRQFARAA